MNLVSPQLDIIDRMMGAFASAADIDAAVAQGLDYVRACLQAQAASFFILDSEQKTITCRACLGPVDIRGFIIPEGKGIVGSTIRQNKTRYIADCAADPDFHTVIDQQTGFTTKSMICAPVTHKQRPFGAIQLINRIDKNGLFSDNDAALVSVLANAAALALANSELTKTMVEAEAIKRDIYLAARVQENLFPQKPNKAAYGRNIPKRGVSGDLFDFVQRGSKIYFCMGDVSGKGVNAALVMSKTHSLFRSLCRPLPDTAQLTADMNRELTETASDGMFVTAIIGQYSLHTKTLQACNAGHEPGLVLGKQNIKKYIPASSPPLGIMDILPTSLSCEVIDLQNARFFAYSDGLTEAEIDGKMAGAAAVADMLHAHGHLGLRQQVDKVIDEIQYKANLIADDLTLLGVGE